MVCTIYDKEPKLLLGDYSKTVNWIDRIVNNNFFSLDSEVPTCRYRGTIVDVGNAANGMVKVTGWQRNVSRLRKMDVSLPTIIAMTINKESIIEDIELDSSFKGSKGLMCSRKYLNNNLRNKLLGQKMDRQLLRNIKLEKMHCFHLVEVVGGMYSYYSIIKDEIRSGQGLHFEEEVSDCYVDDRSIIASGIQMFKNMKTIRYSIRFNEILDKVSFSRNGNMSTQGAVCVEFYMGETLALSDDITIYDCDNGYAELNIFLLRCVKCIRNSVTESNVRFLCTNLYPAAFTGLMVQGISMRTFKNNYNYVMHVLDSLQRPNNVPVCIGALLDEKEAACYFEGYSLKDLI